MSKIEQKAYDIFCSAVRIDSQRERDQFVERACHDSPELHEQVELLLSSDKLSEGFLESSKDSQRTTFQSGRQTDDPDRTQLPMKKYLGESASATGDILPRQFGDYELLEKIAQGGMGVVYKARQTSLRREVAIKMILAGQLACEDEIKRFYIEAEAAAVLDHPGIVPVFDVGCHEGQHFFSMGLVEGQSLADKIKKKPLPPREAATYTKKIAEAVQFAHQQGVVHRDLKPGNVLLDLKGEPRVTDFGLAKRVEVDSELTRTGMIIGTPGYMPPEQASGELDKINAVSDVYAIGAILYALLTGHPPFKGTTQVETIMRVLQEEPLAPRQATREVPADLEAICLKCLEKEPSDRYATAADLVADLNHFLAGEPIDAKNDLLRRLRKWTVREPVLAGQWAVIAAMMLIIVINFLIYSDDFWKSFRVLMNNEVILFAWAVVAFLLQKLHNRVKGNLLIPLTWAAINPVFLTMTLAVNEPPRSSLCSIYLLWLIMTCFFRRVELVMITTVSSVVGYVALLFIFYDQEIKGHPYGHLAVSVLTIIVAGCLCGFLALRLKRLSQQEPK